MASGFPFPLPWYYMIVNIFLMFRFLKARNTNPRLQALATHRAAMGLEGKIPCMFEGFGKPSAPILLPSTPAIDFDFYVPPHATGCGPILQPFPPVMKSHPELDSWLKQRPTVLVNLGSHIIFDEAFATQFAAGLRVLLDRRADVQVLWKLKTQGRSCTVMSAPGGALEIIAKELADGRVRIEDWLPAQPSAILESGHVICMVHHGGANSYHEAIRYVVAFIRLRFHNSGIANGGSGSAGVPQIVLPVWIDTYDFALRCEYLGIGVWGSRTAAPRVEGKELATALLAVLDGPESASMAAKARVLAEPFRIPGREGRVIAAEKIMELLAL